MHAPQTTFPKKSEAELVANLSKAQQDSAKVLAGTLFKMLTELKRGEKDRDEIRRPRWQAGFDLAMGRALAAVVRAQGYNQMLAQARRGMQFQDPRNDTWVIRPDDAIHSEVPSKSRRIAQKNTCNALLPNTRTPLGVCSRNGS